MLEIVGRKGMGCCPRPSCHWSATLPEPNQWRVRAPGIRDRDRRGNHATPVVVLRAPQSPSPRAEQREKARNVMLLSSSKPGPETEAMLRQRARIGIVDNVVDVEIVARWLWLALVLLLRSVSVAGMVGVVP
mmetsp:Transcript_24537/g.67747  ORF Transcript_24537/g.67747 Transcript_24537/m.67747 type:complete len:132 (+) Transcript_24537:2143-2538(+)